MARWDVRFEEDRAFRRSHGSDAKDMEQEGSKVEVTPTATTTRDQSFDDEEEQQH